VVRGVVGSGVHLVVLKDKSRGQGTRFSIDQQEPMARLMRPHREPDCLRTGSICADA
jgi:hypothetical protein